MSARAFSPLGISPGWRKKCGELYCFLLRCFRTETTVSEINFRRFYPCVGKIRRHHYYFTWQSLICITTDQYLTMLALACLLFLTVAAITDSGNWPYECDLVPVRCLNCSNFQELKKALPRFAFLGCLYFYRENCTSELRHQVDAYVQYLHFYECRSGTATTTPIFTTTISRINNWTRSSTRPPLKPVPADPLKAISTQELSGPAILVITSFIGLGLLGGCILCMVCYHRYKNLPPSPPPKPAELRPRLALREITPEPCENPMELENLVSFGEEASNGRETIVPGK